MSESSLEIVQTAGSDHRTEIDEIGPPPRQTAVKLVRLASMVVVIGGWEILGRQIAPLFMSYPSAILREAVHLTMSGELPAAMLDSFRTLLLGFAIATLLGTGIGLLIGRYRMCEAAIDWLVNALYATPLVAIIPLVILWMGLGDAAKLFIVTLLAIFPILINTAAGVRNVSRTLIDVGNAFAASEQQIFRKIVFPAALPYMMAGLRLGIGRAIIAMVVAEFFTAITGLGAMIVKYGNDYDTAAMFVPILVLMVLGVALTGGVRRLEHWIAPWKATEND
jgi:ABC-type nitrate/sulfonate/bicarbonate transport system permease component